MARMLALSLLLFNFFMSTGPALTTAQQSFQKVVDHLKQEYSHLQIGRASAGLVEHIQVDAYGTMQNIKSLASVMIPDAKTISIQPWDKNLLGAIEKAFQTSGLGINPMNNGTAVLLNLPPLTEERRKDLAKVVHKMAEEARIAVRNARQESHSVIRRLEADKQISEDDARHGEKQLQEKVDAVNKQIEELAKSKEKDILTI